MSPGWWGAIAVVVVGAAVVWFGWWNDRRRARAASELALKPTRTIPGVTIAPAYVTDAEILATPVEAVTTSADADLIARRDGASTLPAGAAEAAFLTREGLAVLSRPDVLVLDTDLDADRDVATLLLAAKRRGTPLVIVAAGFSPAALGTLRANLVKGTVRTLPVPLADASARRRAVALTGGQLIDPADLASGWLPSPAWGACDGWVADTDDSWILVSGRGGDTPIETDDPRPAV